MYPMSWFGGPWWLGGLKHPPLRYDGMGKDVRKKVDAMSLRNDEGTKMSTVYLCVRVCVCGLHYLDIIRK